MALQKSSKLSNLYFFILLLPIFVFTSQAAFASSGDIHTYAGLGMAGFSGDGGQATAARLNAPSCVASDAAGNLYISDRANQRIRKIDTAGKISTIAGVGAAGYSGDGGSAILAKLNNPSGIAADSAGNVFFADMGNNRVRKISASGNITAVAGTGAARFAGDGGPAVSAAINHAEGIAVDSKGDIYVSDTGNNRIRMIDATGIIKTVAGTGAAGFAGDGGPAISAKLNRPVGIALDAAGKLYIADCYNQRVRVIDLNGGITTLAGDGTPGLSGNGELAMSASLRFPSGVSVTASGNVYIADWHNQGVRVVNTSGTINALAGTGVAGFSGDGAAAGNAGLRYPFGLTTDSKGNIFIADSKNNRVRMIEGPSYALPVSTITSPVSDCKAFAGSSGLTVTGTASAASGVSFVEVSTDGGMTWGTASGTATWNYKWTPEANGAYLIMSRATDSSGAHETIISCSYVNVIRLAPPGSKITHPKNGAKLTGSTAVVNGVAADGKVGGVTKVEVSTDGGASWNTAKGASLWSYTWTPPQNGSYTIMTRATDKAGNVEVPGTGITVTATVPVTVNNLVPSLPAADPGQAVTWTAAAAGGSGNYKYQFLRKGPDTAGAYALVQDWSSSNNWNWTIGLSSVGANSILVNAMDSSITTAATGISINSRGEGYRSKAYTVGAASAINISSITPSVSSAVAGNTVTWTASATGGSGTYQYQFMRTGPDTGGTAVVAKAYGTSNTWSWTTTQAMAGSNTISVYVKNSDGTGQVTSTAPAYTVSTATVPAIVVNSLVPSVASPATAGASVNWTASATGGSGTYQYQFSRMGPDTSGAYVVAQGWGSSSSWNWATTSSIAGTNTIMVSVRNSDGSGTVSKSVTYTIAQVVTAIVIGSISPSIPSPAIVGTSVTWTASASGGSGTYQYQFSRTGPDTGGTAVVAQAWGTAKTWAWTSTSAMVGTNTITVGVRNSDGTGAVTSTTPAYTVSYAPIAASSLTANPSTATAGASVTWTAAATGGSGSYQYQFSRTGPDTGGSSVVQAFSASNTLNWATTSAMAGSNTVSVSVKDSTGAAATASVAYTLSASTPPPLSDGLAVSPTTATAGTTVTCTSTASGGSGGYQYQFSRSGPDTSGAFVVTQAYGTPSSWNWATTSAMAGSNTIKVTIKDSSGATTTNSDAYTLAAVTSTGNSYYMAPTGSDSNSGTISSPWKTWASASKKLKAGDTLYARGGTYTGQGSSSNGSVNWYSPSGTQAAPITFKAYPGEVPVFDGQMSVVSGLTLSNVSWIVVDGLTFTQYSGDAGIMCGNWGAGNVSNVTIQNCVVHDSGQTLNQDHAMYLSAGCSNFIVRNNFLYNCVNGAGIQCWHSPGIVNIQIYNNVMYNDHWGIVMGDGASGVSVYNNTIDKCYIGLDWGQTGETVLTGVVNAISKNNIITNSSYCGLRVGSFDSTQVTSDYNLYYGNATDIIWSGSNYSVAGYKSAHPGEQHSIGASPSYVSASTGNYQLNSGSPAIGAGTPQTLFNTTITGATRTSWDIGPY